MSPRVSIIVTTYLAENKRYLDLCVKSIRNLAYDNFEVIIVGREGYAPQYDNTKTVYPPGLKDFGCAYGINYGISWSDPGSKFIFTINDDVILTKNCLTKMVTAASGENCIINPTSNCDNHGLYSLILGVPRGDELIPFGERQYKYEQLEPFADELMNAESFYPPGGVTQSLLYFYATLIPRKVWDKVGQFDDNFHTGQDDVDYSWRARSLGIPLGFALDAVVWHFSGASADKTLTDPVRIRNLKYFHEKWGKFPSEVPRATEEFFAKQPPTGLVPPKSFRELDFIGE